MSRQRKPAPSVADLRLAYDRAVEEHGKVSHDPDDPRRPLLQREVETAHDRWWKALLRDSEALAAYLRARRAP